MLACLCHILAMIDDTFAEAAEVIDFIADVVFAIISSCMIAQVNHELKNQPRPFDPQRAANAPPRSGSKAMRQMQGGGGVCSVPQQMQMGGGRYGGGY